MAKKESFGRRSSRKPAAGKAEKQSDDLSAAMKRMERSKARVAAKQASASKEPAIKAEHTVVSGDTLGGLALKYYGSAVRDKWMVIYEANKEEIGDNPSAIRVGQVLQIPELDE
ncbi:MAG: LysM peptidoglycan-binding domain-containing protein [Chloroflexi bacterium]|nr:LysM peptidoglycan-binding domain-containing protein [Chloroflexota bacterium]